MTSPPEPRWLESLETLWHRQGAGGEGPLVLWASTHAGIEDVAASEFLERAARAGLGDPSATPGNAGREGRVRLEARATPGRMLSVAVQLRSVHHLFLPVRSFPLIPGRELAGIAEALEATDLPVLASARSFRVTTQRIGVHDFRSMDVQREAGAVLQRRYGTSVDLENFEVEVRVDVVNDTVDVALQLTRKPLSRRFPRAVHHPAALQPNLAYALLRLSGIEARPGALLDPFCGSGTLLLEAAELAGDAWLVGSDRYAKAVSGAQENLSRCGLEGRVRWLQADALRLETLFQPARFRYVVTNPPYGTRMGRRLDFRSFYGAFLRSAAWVLEPGGRLVLMARRRGDLNAALRTRKEYRTLHVRVVRTGEIYPGVFVLERR